MANRKQLAILKQGVAAWNKWREENPDAKIDLRRAKLDELDLSGANFSKADIRGTSFINCNLISACFSESKIGCITKNNWYILLSIISITLIYEIYSLSLNHQEIHLYKLAFFTYLLISLLFLNLKFIENKSISDKLFKNKNGAEKINILDRFFHFFIFIFITDFTRSDISYGYFNKASVGQSIFDNAILTGTSWINAQEKEQISCNNTIFADKDVRNLLMRGHFEKKSMKGKDLHGAHLVGFVLYSIDFQTTNLMQANLSGADITGAKLYGSARENWIIDGIRCDYVYWDEAGEQRTPPDRDFRSGEFEELYKQLPTFEYFFEQGITLLDPLIMNRVVEAINERHKEFSLELVNFDKRGQPHATFTVCHLDYVEKAKEQITAGYEASKGSPEQQEQLMAAVMGLIENQSKSLDIIKQLGGTAMGDTYNIHGGQIGAIGKKSLAAGNTFQQITADLSRLHEEMQRTASNSEQQAAAEDVAKAEQAARQQDEPAMQRHLKNAGKFALDCAQKIGTDVLTEYLKKITIG